MKFNNPYWNNTQKIEMLQRWILVHSHLYYDLNTSIVSDYMFDYNSTQLITLSEAHPESLINSRYYYAMKDFDGSSGFGYVQRLHVDDYDCIIRDCNMLLKLKEDRDG